MILKCLCLFRSHVMLLLEIRVGETQWYSTSLKIVLLLDIIPYTAGTAAADVWEHILGRHDSRSCPFTSSWRHLFITSETGYWSTPTMVTFTLRNTSVWHLALICRGYGAGCNFCYLCYFDWTSVPEKSKKNTFCPELALEIILKCRHF